MKAKARESGISFVRFLAALAGLRPGESGATSGQKKPCLRGIRPAAASAALALLLLAATALWTRPALAQTVLTPQPGPALAITSVPVNTIYPGDHYDPHVDGNWVVYTSDIEIHYYDLGTGTDAGIPMDTSLQDLLSDVQGGRIVYSRVLPDGTVAIMLFDITSGTRTEIDPQPGHTRFSAKIGGDTIVYVDSNLATGGEVIVYDLPTKTPTRLTNDLEIDQNPRLSRDGNTLVWEHCQSTGTLCDIWQAVKSNGTWTVSVASNDPSHEEFPDTNGNLIVYDSDRPNGAGDIFYRPVSGGTETQIQLPGIQINPKIAGSYVVFESRNGGLGDIFLYDILANQFYNLTNTSSLNEELDTLTLLPSGEVIVVYDSDEHGTTNRSVHALRFMGPSSAPNQPPAPAIVSSPANPTNLASAYFTYSDSESGVTFQCSLDGQAFSPCASSGVNYTVADGSHTFAVKAVDSLGTASVPASDAWVVDTVPPSISIVAPANNASYVLNSSLHATYSCTDSGTGVAACAGTAANGAAISTASAGAMSFTVNASDNAGNTASQSVSYAISYNVCLLYDPTKARKSGSTYPIQIQLCDAAGHNVSSSGIIVQALSVTRLTTNAPGVLDDAGNSNPDFDFRYDSGLGGYIFNLKTTGFSTGTYNLNFSAGSDPVVHSAPFQIK